MRINKNLIVRSMDKFFDIVISLVVCGWYVWNASKFEMLPSISAEYKNIEWIVPWKRSVFDYRIETVNQFKKNRMGLETHVLHFPGHTIYCAICMEKAIDAVLFTIEWAHCALCNVQFWVAASTQNRRKCVVSYHSLFYLSINFLGWSAIEWKLRLNE